MTLPAVTGVQVEPLLVDCSHAAVGDVGPKPVALKVTESPTGPDTLVGLDVIPGAALVTVSRAGFERTVAVPVKNVAR